MHGKYYEILGLPDGASFKKVKKAYRNLVLKYHPDRNPDQEDAGKKMTEINDAYTVLYRYLQKKPKSSGSVNVERDLEIDYVNDPEYKWLYSRSPEPKDKGARGYSKRLMFFEDLLWVILTVYCFLIWWCILSLLLFVPYTVTMAGNEGNGVLLLIALSMFFLWSYLFKQLIYIKNE